MCIQMDVDCVNTVCLTRNQMETKWQEGNGEHRIFLYFPQHDANSNKTPTIATRYMCLSRYHKLQRLKRRK